MRCLLELFLLVWLLLLMPNPIPKLYNAVVSCSTLIPTILMKKKEKNEEKFLKIKLKIYISAMNFVTQIFIAV